jgi:integrase
MADLRYLKKRHQTWYFALAVPVAARGKFISEGRNGHSGKPLAKVVESLGTQSLKEAQDRRWPLVHEWRERFKRTMANVPLTLAEIEFEAREIYTSLLERLEAAAKRGKYTGDPVLSADGEIIHTPEQAAIDAACEATIETLADEDWGAVSVEIAAVERRKGIKIEPSSDTYRRLARAILTAQIDAMTGRLRLLRGEPSEAPVTFTGVDGIDPVTLRPIVPLRRPLVRIRSGEGITFSEAAALFIEEMQRDPGAKVTEHTRGQHESVFKLFEDFTGDASLATITKATASDFLNTIAKLDPHWNHIEDARKTPLDDLVAKCAGRPGKLSNRTLNRYISHLFNVFKWADKQSKYEGRNPFQGQNRKEAKGTGWKPYTIDELNKVFGSETFTSATTQERIRPAKYNFKSAMRWIPLIGLFGGMRSNEICQLRKSDLQRKDGIWVFNVSADHESQSVKTEAAIRIVPIHSEIIRCGFLDYVKALPDGQLWPALRPGGVDGKLNNYFSKRFPAFRRKWGVTRPRVSFHSFRKNVAQALKDARATPAETAELIGHEQGFTFGTYAPLQLPMPALKELIERVKYPGLRLDHLHVYGVPTVENMARELAKFPRYKT